MNPSKDTLLFFRVIPVIRVNFSFTLDEPDLRIPVRMLGFEWERLELRRFVLQVLIPSLRYGRFKRSHGSGADCAISLAYEEFSDFGPVTARLVKYRIARLRDNRNGEIVEPLAFLSLMQWLHGQGHLNLE